MNSPVGEPTKRQVDPVTASPFLTPLANFLVLLLIVVLLLFTIYLARTWRRARREMENKIQQATSETLSLKKTIEKQEFVIEQLRKRLRELQEGREP